MKEKTLQALEYYKIIEKLVEKAESQLGKDKLKETRPLTNLEEILSLSEETDEALSLLIKRGSPPLFGIHSVKDEIRRVDMGGTLTPGALLKICDSLRVSRALKLYIKESKDDRSPSYPIIEGIIEGLRVYKSIEESISKAIVSENEISDNASSNLRSIRKQILVKNEAIKDKLNSIIASASYKKYLQDTIITMREGRYVVPVKQEKRNKLPGIIHDMSSSRATAFVEPMAVVDLNNQLREFEIKEKEEIEKILSELSALVGEGSEGILGNQYGLRSLDMIFAKGKLALEMRATKAILNNKGYINLKEARHPLLKDEEVVPIDVYLGKEFTSLIITGPNTGGKTVSLKTVGLLTLMAQSGLHIPADYNSEIAVFDQVFADIGDEQSIEQSLSTFSSHMVNIVDILKNIKANSLVLFDELGAGTDPTEGAALAMSILDYLLNLNIRTMATTHYSQLKVYALTREKVTNASVEFDIETLRPTYKLLIGLPGKSNAFEISRRLGLDDFIIDYAQDFISRENIEFEDVLHAIEKDRKQIEEEKYEAEKTKKEIEKLKNDLLLQKEKSEARRNEILDKAKEEAKNLLISAREESDLIIRELRKVLSQIDKEKRKDIQDAQNMLKLKIEEMDSSRNFLLEKDRRGKAPSNLKIGDSVEVLSLNQKGLVISEADENGNLFVQVGILKVNVNIDNLARAKAEERQVFESRSKKLIGMKSKTIKKEIDLRGKNIEEAIFDLDKYIDDSYLAGLKEVTIIHGKGTGALREGLKDYFTNHKLVKSFRLGSQAEGGTGVSLLELK